MTKTDLVNLLRDRLDLPKVVAISAVNTILDAIVDAVVNDDTVILPGFGKWSRKTQPAKVARNPTNGQSVNVPAKNVVRFRVGTSFKRAVKESKVG